MTCKFVARLSLSLTDKTQGICRALCAAVLWGTVDALVVCLCVCVCIRSTCMLPTLPLSDENATVLGTGVTQETGDFWWASFQIYLHTLS